MRGESRRKKKTDWKALALQILISVLSDLIGEALLKAAKEIIKRFS